MMHTFYKYQGTGNDFIIIDNRFQIFNKEDKDRIQFLCNRRFGVGADGLILLEEDNETDFKMIYFNSDGMQGSMCGNGGRCVVAFAKHLGIINDKATFNAIDGVHYASIKNNLVKLKMQDVSSIKNENDHVILDTGSPHYVCLQEKLEEFDVKTKGADIRYAYPDSSGINVNFVQRINDDEYFVRTYERGVEDETLSCGTGVTAVALAMHSIGETDKEEIVLRTSGGDLQVSFNKSGNGYTNIYLIGPATFVYTGEI